MGQGAPALRQPQPQNMQTRKQFKEAEKRRKALQAEAQKQNLTTPVQAVETPQQTQARLAQEVAQSQQRNREAGEAGYQTMQSRLRNAQGFSPEQARLMQYEAHKGIQREEQAAQRNLVGAQGMRGIGGRSGIGYAQRRDMNQQYAGQHQQAQSDYNRLNEQQKYANVAAGTAYGEGQSAGMNTDWQEALEREERRKYKEANPNFGKDTYQFMKV